MSAKAGQLQSQTAASLVSRSPFPERIETARLILRPPTMVDALTIAEAVNASYVELHEWMKWARGLYGLHEVQTYCESTREAMAAGREYPVLLTHRDDRRIVGAAGLINVKWDVPMREIAQAAARATEEELGRDRLGPWSDFQWGTLNGKLSALRWVLGEDWDMLDT